MTTAPSRSALARVATISASELKETLRPALSDLDFRLDLDETH
jgi:hypothetical protein